jgi:hypothetical protein
MKNLCLYNYFNNHRLNEEVMTLINVKIFLLDVIS